MADEILFDEKFGTLYYNAELPYIMYVAHTFMKGEQFKEMLEVQLQSYREKKPLHDQLFVIGDTRLQGVIAKPEQEWLDQYWNVEMYEAGLREIAFIVPESVFGSMSMKNYTENTQAKTDRYEITTPMFKSLEEAKVWLRSRKKSDVKD